ncbi:MAG TPA: hypothetical protein VFX66_00440 [Sulfuricurvum sp.]|nr:hypothetical protein [Sulfuricurvum sp.]
MTEIKPLSIGSYLSHNEIQTLLEKVDFIMMASPSLQSAPDPSLHFTIILNTSDLIPDTIKQQLLEKFCSDYNITDMKHVLNNRERIAFAITSQDTPMPRHLIDDAEANTIPWALLHIIDFLGESEGFQEAKDGLSGWSYSYNS